jgi:threonine/homoserine/homoserine lactone efflux protein
MGLSLWRGARALGPSVGALPELRSSRETFVRAAVTNLLNPKAYVFMLAVFPQFLRPEYGPLAVQALALGAIIASTQAGVYGAVALLAGSVRGWLETHPAANRAMARGVGALLILVAAVTLVEGWRRA